MAIETQPAVYTFVCDCCGARERQGHRIQEPAHWYKVMIVSYIDREKVVDVDCLLCRECGERLVSEVEGKNNPERPSL